ncbi:uncharacterized protein LOC144690181 [Cetorhinus maximus]
MNSEFWSLSTGPYPLNLGLLFTVSLLLLILLLISCGNCMRKPAQFATENNYMESKGDSQLLRISQLEDSRYPESISEAITQGAPGSRKVSCQNDMQVTGTQDHGDFPSQHSRALPEIPNVSLSKENSDGKGDPVYQTANELTAAMDLQPGEGPAEPPYAASNQFSLETPKAQFIIEDDAGKEKEEEDGSQLKKVAPVYARVNKKPKETSPLNLHGRSSPHENVECEDEPPPIPDKCFGDDDDVGVSESSDSKIVVDGASDEASKDGWVSADPSVNEGRYFVATHNGTTVGKLL